MEATSLQHAFGQMKGLSREKNIALNEKLTHLLTTLLSHISQHNGDPAEFCEIPL